MAASFDNKTHTHTNKFLRDLFFFFKKIFSFGFHHFFLIFFIPPLHRLRCGMMCFLDSRYSPLFFYVFFFIYGRLGNPNQKVHLKKNDNPKE